jgi:hypothetical protein
MKFRSDYPDHEIIIRTSLQKLQEAEDKLKKTITIPPREIIPQIEEEGRMVRFFFLFFFGVSLINVFCELT